MITDVALENSAPFRIGVGVDMTVVSRIKRLVTRYPASRDRLFTTGEFAYCCSKRRRYEHLAARFAAKEAVLKAFGSGLRNGVRWKDVEILTEPDGHPRVRLAGNLASIAERDGLSDLDVSLSHTEDIAIAYVVSIWGRCGGTRRGDYDRQARGA
jgi:holo-[acyl-carrier protein] synthase